ncbi:MAG TPA: hypothetical protein VIH33_01275 [Candidatus Limnocylindria bacterium]|jgi:hypothetical protein
MPSSQVDGTQEQHEGDRQEHGKLDQALIRLRDVERTHDAS